MVPIVEFLIDNGVNIEEKTKNQYTSLHVACEDGHLSIVQYIIEKKIILKKIKINILFSCCLPISSSWKTAVINT